MQFIPDRFLLRRLCRQCRKKQCVAILFYAPIRSLTPLFTSSLVRVTFLKRLHPDLHPLVKDCLIPSFCAHCPFPLLFVGSPTSD